MRINQSLKDEPKVFKMQTKSKSKKNSWSSLTKLSRRKKQSGLQTFRFAERNEKKLVDVVEREMQSLGMIKAEFTLSMKMTKN